MIHGFSCLISPLDRNPFATLPSAKKHFALLSTKVASFEKLTKESLLFFLDPHYWNSYQYGFGEGGTV